jgi:hypothetical protein
MVLYITKTQSVAVMTCGWEVSRFVSHSIAVQWGQGTEPLVPAGSTGTHCLFFRCKGLQPAACLEQREPGEKDVVKGAVTIPRVGILDAEQPMRVVWVVPRLPGAYAGNIQPRLSDSHWSAIHAVPLLRT